MNGGKHKEIERAVTRALHGRSNVLMGAALLSMSMTAVAADEAAKDVEEVVVTVKSGPKPRIDNVCARPFVR